MCGLSTLCGGGVSEGNWVMITKKYLGKLKKETILSSFELKDFTKSPPGWKTEASRYKTHIRCTQKTKLGHFVKYAELLLHRA